MTDYNAAKFDQDKVRYDLITPEFEEALAKVMTFGAVKYSAHSWMNVPDAEERYYSALRRHVAAYRSGELLDPESGMHHLAHAGCCLYFLYHLSMGNAHEQQRLPLSDTCGGCSSGCGSTCCDTEHHDCSAGGCC